MANVDDFFIDDNSVGLISEASYENINSIIDAFAIILQIIMRTIVKYKRAI